MIGIVNRFKASSLTGGADMVRTSRRTYLVRALILIVCVLVGFSDTFELMLYNLSIGAANYSVLTILMTLVLFVGLDQKRARALDIHDREVDYIVSGMAIIIAITIKVQLLPRFLEWDSLLRLDFLAILVFSFGLCGWLFGMRSTLNFGPGWLLLFGYNAPIYLMISVAFGGGFWGPVMANIIGVSLALMIASNRDTVQSIYFGLMTIAAGVVFGVLTWLLFGEFKNAIHFPALFAVVFVVLVSSRGHVKRWVIRQRMPTVRKVFPAVIGAAVATAVLAYYPIPGLDKSTTPIQQGPKTISSPGVEAPADWEVTAGTQYEWASAYFGPDSSLVRQTLTAREYNPDWDPDGFKRTVVVDSLRATDANQARTFGDEAIYSTLTGRRSADRDIDLGYGIWGRAYTVLDEAAFLSYTKLVFEWQREDGISEKIVVIAVDDHRPEATFPELAPSATRMFVQALTILLRGNEVTIDTETKYKDLDLVSKVARDIVAEEEES